LAFLTARIVIKPHSLPSEADELIELIKRAGPEGISNRQLRGQIEFPNQLLDEILKDVAGAGQIFQVGTNRKTVFVGR